MSDLRPGFCVVEVVKNALNTIFPLIDLLDAADAVDVSHASTSLQTKLLMRIQEASSSALTSSAASFASASTQTQSSSAELHVQEVSAVSNTKEEEEAPEMPQEPIFAIKIEDVSEDVVETKPQVARSSSRIKTKPITFMSLQVDTLGTKKKRKKRGRNYASPKPSEELKENILGKSSLAENVCVDCGKEFGNIYEMRRHSVVHSKIKSFSCDICERKFSRRDHLKCHKDKHEDNSHVRKTSAKANARVKPCLECGKTFVNNVLLRQHASLAHPKARPFNCDLCVRAFASRQHLTYHRRGHTGEKPFRCSECGQNFALNSTLKTHAKTHENGKNLCSVCGARFGMLSLLKKHEMSMHEAADV